MKPPAKTCLRCSAVLVLDISSLTRCELVRSLASGLTWSGLGNTLTLHKAICAIRMVRGGMNDPEQCSSASH